MNPVLSQILVIAERVAIAAIVLVAGYVLARTVRRLLYRGLERTEFVRLLGPSMAQLSSALVYCLILVIALIGGLVGLGVPNQIVTLVLAVLFAIAAIFFFALQQSVANLTATILFLVFQPFRRGELVEIMGRVGTVREILLFSTVLEMADHRLVSLPNSKIQETGVVNYSRMNQIWADVSLSVSYAEDLDHVRTVLTEIAAQDARILAHPPFKVFVEDFGERGVRLSARPTVLPAHQNDVRSDLRARIKARFDAVGIQFAIIPPPAKPVGLVEPVKTPGP